ncbi:transmembrane protein 223 [Notolabrus celidotus]|uniref:transmembrane protein 223 n=1 Tax=Notolabrus celidotus TaxID=1203425 RepID=UPI00148F97E1|nr:transmembrane protein 223 [Notolabrus celidotus]
MGLERFLRGTLTCFSAQFRHVTTLQKVSVVCVPGRSNEVIRSTSITGLCCRLFSHTSHFGTAHRQLVPRRSLGSSVQPPRDVTLFQHDRTRFFRLLSVFCGGQFLFWTYLGHFAFHGLRDTRASSVKEKDKVATTFELAGMWSFEMNLGSSAWRYGFTAGCLAIGAWIVGLAVLYCRRSVSQVVLHQGGKMVTVTTQSPLGPGRGRRITVPLSQVACHAHRQESPSFIPLRVKGHKFYYLLDKDGTVNNTRLFDITVGAYRAF